MQPLNLPPNQSVEDNSTAQEEGVRMEWKAVKDQTNQADWRVESIDFENEGEVNVVLFSGPRAQSLATEYAQWKNSVEQGKPVQRAVR